MGLNKSFVFVMGNILMINPLHTIYEVHALLVKEERHWQVYILPMIPKTKTNLLNINIVRKKWRNICKCYRLNDFPPNFIFGRGKRVATVFEQKRNNALT